MSVSGGRTSPSNGTTRGWVIGRIGGAPVILAPSLLVTAAILTVLFAPVVTQFAPQVRTTTALIVAFCFALLLFASVFLHELAHGLVATWRGQRVHEYAITLWGGHTQFSTMTGSPGTSALVAVVGPVTNLLLGGAFWVAFLAAPERSLLSLVLLAGAGANGFVGVFNLIPGLPLDGGRILEAVVWKITGDRARGAIVAGWGGRAVAVGVVVLVLGRDFAAGRQPDLFSIAWVVLIASFLWAGASSAIRAAQVQRALAEMSLERLARPAVGVPGTVTVAEARRAATAAGGVHIVLLAPDGRPAAYIDSHAVAAVPPEQWETTPVSAVAVPLPVGAVVPSDLAGQELVRVVAQVSRFSPIMAVVRPGGVGGAGEPGTVIGLLAAQDVISALRG